MQRADGADPDYITKMLDGKRAVRAFRPATRHAQFEAVNNGLPPLSLISAAHIFWIEVTTLSGIGT
jgi:hypothetical protein